MRIRAVDCLSVSVKFGNLGAAWMEGGPGLGSGESTSQVSHVPRWQVGEDAGGGEVGCHFSPCGLLSRAI